jgi:ribosomal protein S18 acetylase RimI-like enzyme
MAVSDDYLLLVVETDQGGLVGYAAAGPYGLDYRPVPETSGEVARLYLLPDWHGQGLGSDLLERCLAFLTARYDPIFVSVYAGNTGARRLYERHGFVHFADYEYRVGEQRDPEHLLVRKP